jgi:cell division protein FtsN
MPKDYAKFVPPKARTSAQKRGYSALFFTVVFVLLTAVLVSYFLYEKKETGSFAAASKNIATYSSKLWTQINTKKPAIQAEPRTLIGQNTVRPPVHFDFYNELPKMQVYPDQPSESMDLSPKTHATVITQSQIPVDKVDRTNTKKAIFDPDEVSELLAAEKETQSYTLQLDTFETEQAAKGLQKALASIGFDVRIVKINAQGKAIYFVQQGPYKNKALAKISQQLLQKRGITSVLR